MAESDALPALAEILAGHDGSEAGVARVAEGLDALSGLPGPRANLAVAWAFAARAPSDLVLALTSNAGEFVRMCAVVALGRLRADDPAGGAEWEARLRSFAGDPSWRVREGVAMALQLLGDRDPAALRVVAKGWSSAPDASVARAAIAGICEPRLLRDRATTLVALDACAAATRVLLAMPPARRREPDARTLRQALGYCWSVAVAGSPEAGLARFRGLDAEDGDVAWIIRENSRKARLRRLLGDAGAPPPVG